MASVLLVRLYIFKPIDAPVFENSIRQATVIVTNVNLLLIISFGVWSFKLISDLIMEFSDVNVPSYVLY